MFYYFKTILFANHRIYVILWGYSYKWNSLQARISTVDMLHHIELRMEGLTREQEHLRLEKVFMRIKKKQELWQVWRAVCLSGCFQRYIDCFKNILSCSNLITQIIKKKRKNVCPLLDLFCISLINMEYWIFLCLKVLSIK